MHQTFTSVRKHYHSLEKKLFSLRIQIQRRVMGQFYFESPLRFVQSLPEKGFALEKSPKVSSSQCFLMLFPGEICFLDKKTLISRVNNFTLNIIGAQVYEMRFTICEDIRNVLWCCISRFSRLTLGPITGTRTICLVTVLSLCHRVILSRLVRLTLWIVLCVKPWTVEGWVRSLIVLLWLWSWVAHGGSRYYCAVSWWCFLNCFQYNSKWWM